MFPKSKYPPIRKAVIPAAGPRTTLTLRHGLVSMHARGVYTGRAVLPSL